MTFDEARDVMLAIVKAIWDPTGYPIVWTDVPDTVPTSETVWARATVRHSGGGQSSLSGEDGTRRFERTGTLFIQVFAPVGDGSTAGYGAAQTMINGLEDARNPSVWFKDILMQELGQYGSFEQINVQATFSYDDVR